MGHGNGKGLGSTLFVEVDADGVAMVRMDVPGESVNTLHRDFSPEFSQVLDKLDQDPSIKCAVFYSGKSSGFIAGADIRMLDGVTTAEAGKTFSQDAQKVFNQLAGLKVPVVAAIDGACLGGGLELALACTDRVATNSRGTQLGLPEVQLGLIPGAGGTQRLPRLIGIQPALDMMLTGNAVRADKAKRLGLVSKVVPKAILLSVAKRRALELASQAGRKPGNHHAASLLQRMAPGPHWQTFLLEDNPIGRRVLWDQAKKQVKKKTGGHYPAPFGLIEAVRVGMDKGMQKGLQAEATEFGKLIITPVAKQLMFLFFATTELKKDSGIDESHIKAQPVTKVGVLGCGLMGAGIASVTALQAGLPVRMKDRRTEDIGRGLAHVRAELDAKVKRRSMHPRERDTVMARVSGGTDLTGFADAEVVIEAVFEDISLKQQMVQEVEAAGKLAVIFASNTSSLPISRIAEGSKHPETVIGMHYFSPVEKMPLLEIVITKKTAPWVTATCVALGKAQGKKVIVVRDGPGFYTSRIIGPYMNEAAFMLEQGAAIDVIDRALVQFGFPVGPLTLLDEVGIDVGYKVSHILSNAFGARMKASALLDKLVTAKRLGRKNKSGLYVYSDTTKGKKSKEVDGSVYDVLGVKPARVLDAKIMVERCVLQMVNEAVRCLEEGILRSARDGDVGAVFGLGFPPFLGGPFRYVDSVGVDQVVKQLQKLETQFGSRFTPAQLLIDMAAEGRRFYPHTQPKDGKRAQFSGSSSTVSA